MSTRNRNGSARKMLWWQVYRQRIRDGKERCRHCGVCRTDLTFDHLRPAAHGASLRFDNATILCEPHNLLKDDQRWPHLVSLAKEEAAAPPERRWAAIAQAESIAAWEATRGKLSPEREALMPLVEDVLAARHPESLEWRDVARDLGYDPDGPAARDVLGAMRVLQRRGRVEPDGFRWRAAARGGPGA